MPRKKLIYTHDRPYHIVARANNKEWFYLPIEQVWEIFVNTINHLSKNYGLRCHAFVLMNNHYHMCASTSNKNLGEVFCEFQKSVSRTINAKAHRINHVFGGPYKPSLINTEVYYYHALKYLYRNPVEAGIVDYVEEYPYSTLRFGNSEIKQPKIIPLDNGIDAHIPSTKRKLLSWLNEDYGEEAKSLIRKALSKTEFKIVFKEKRRKLGLTW